MSIKIQRVEGLSILLAVAAPPLEAEDALEIMAEATEMKKQFPGQKIYRVMDFTQGIDFSGMMVCMATEKDHEGGANDPDIETYFVGSSELIALGVKALKEQEQYGVAPNVHLFLSVDEALQLATDQCKSKA